MNSNKMVGFFSSSSSLRPVRTGNSRQLGIRQGLQCLEKPEVEAHISESVYCEIKEADSFSDKADPGVHSAQAM